MSHKFAHSQPQPHASPSPETTLPVLTLAEFEQLVRDVFALVQRDRATAKIDVVALTGKAFSPAEQSQIKDLLGLYFTEVAARAIDTQTAPTPFGTEEMQDWMHHHLRPAA